MEMLGTPIVWTKTHFGRLADFTLAFANSQPFISLVENISRTPLSRLLQTLFFLHLSTFIVIFDRRIFTFYMLNEMLLKPTLKSTKFYRTPTLYLMQ
jgi:hypothetical protein